MLRRAAPSGRIGKWIVVVLFFGVISTPMMRQLVSYRDGQSEYRVPPPGWLGFRRLREFTKALDAYISDNFGLPRQLVRWNSWVRYQLGTSSTPNVVIGADGWLFYAGEKIIEQHIGQNVFTPEELEHWVAVMTASRDWLAQRGIPFIILVAPDKSTIYPEKLPTYPRPPGRTTRLDQLAERLKGTNLILVDPRQRLLEAKATGSKPYYQGDSHWTQFGAFVAYQQLIEHVKAQLPAVVPVLPTDYSRAPIRPTGDLPVLFGLQNDLIYTAERWTRRVSHQLHTTTRGPSSSDPWPRPIKFFETDLKGQPRLLIFGDSFTDYVLGPTFLYETFRDPVYTHHNGGQFDFRLVGEVKPNLVVYQLAERYLANDVRTPLGF